MIESTAGKGIVAVCIGILCVNLNLILTLQTSEAVITQEDSSLRLEKDKRVSFYTHTLYN